MPVLTPALRPGKADQVYATRSACQQRYSGHAGRRAGRQHVIYE